MITATFLLELRLLATKCNFGNSLKDMLQDQIVIRSQHSTAAPNGTKPDAKEGSGDSPSGEGGRTLYTADV